MENKAPLKFLLFWYMEWFFQAFTVIVTQHLHSALFQSTYSPFNTLTSLCGPDGEYEH